ncbi:hypothetical protein H696_02508 [Fonticula alba]|uniref:ABC transporter domain-containing protein n=1 Tax=Fonticula alba TaxID=691883 RepID=A0A058ZCA8_FONAL|nr:hypothetical protein H696_02508 [Fonticula alba]KCV71568.1 hypothetical protein H696_02508 [Fonticula alba]|eukprot:XP_009494691.1 hypothetical protein H696_02508 [Fonticula alba]
MSSVSLAHQVDPDAPPGPRAGPLKSFPSRMQDSGFAGWLAQLKIMLWKYYVLQIKRYWRSTLLQVLAPILFLLILFALDRGSSRVSRQIGADPDAPEAAWHTSVPPVAPCWPPFEGRVRESSAGSRERCATIAFAPGDDPTVRDIMRRVARNNAARGGRDFHVPDMTVASAPVSLDWSRAAFAEELARYPPPPGDGLVPTVAANADAGFVPVATVEDLARLGLSNPNSTLFGISFEPGAGANTHTYQVWYNATVTPLDNKAFTPTAADRTSLQLASLIRALDEAMIQHHQQDDQFRYEMSARSWPLIASNGTSRIAQTSTPVFLIACGLVNFILLLGTVVSEKESYQRHSMQMMGLAPSVYWISHLLCNLPMITLISLVTLAFGNIFGISWISQTSPGIVFFMFFMLQLSLTALAFFLSTLLRTAKTASTVGLFVLIISLLLQAAVFNNSYSGYIWWEAQTHPSGQGIMGLLVPPFNFGKLYLDISSRAVGAFSFASDMLIPGEGFRWEHLGQPIPPSAAPVGNFDIPLPRDSFFWFIGNFLIFMLLTWYFDQVIPGPYGKSAKLWFPFMPSYWGFGGGATAGQMTLSFPPPTQLPDEDKDVFAERVATLAEDGASAAVRVTQLRKVYRSLFGGKENVAVVDSSFRIAPGSVLALLGQNGAGKSTTISMICGFTAPSSGDVYLFGQSVTNSLSAIRNSLGVCPQFDILFEQLTGMEHIRLFAGIRNIDPALLEDLARERLGCVRLWGVRNRFAGDYSGGMKRRLSVALATLGDPGMLVLDEPTTGMDPVNRRHVWNFIDRFKKGRAVVLTTHSMEEAEFLGDTIAIMSLGRLRAFGTSTRLKTTLGAGYQLTVLVSSDPALQVVAGQGDPAGAAPAASSTDDPMEMKDLSAVSGADGTASGGGPATRGATASSIAAAANRSAVDIIRSALTELIGTAAMTHVRLTDDSAGSLIFSIGNHIATNSVPVIVRWLESFTKNPALDRDTPPSTLLSLESPGGFGASGAASPLTMGSQGSLASSRTTGAPSISPSQQQPPQPAYQTESLQAAAAIIRDWSISQTTLEEVFLSLIRQVNPTRTVS